MYSSDRNQLRQMFFQVWHKAQNNLPMEPLEAQIATVIERHPEYHAILENKDAHLDRDYSVEMGETNPFLHMSMHLALIEQLSTDRPAGIKQIYQQLMARVQDNHETEHQMMECLAEALWQSQQNQSPPDEQAYLHCLNALAQK
jgi:hypothetical protein